MDEILEAIRDQCAQQVFPCWELALMLENVGFTPRQTSAIIKEAIARKQLGVVSFGKPRRKPTKSRLLVII